MKKIGAPQHAVQLALEQCADGIADRGFALRLLGIADELNAAERVYAEKGAAGELYSISPTMSVGDWVDGSEMKRLYSGTFARKGSKARYIYDAILSRAPAGLCPLCSQRPASTLDHYLAKTLHPALAITPLNLIPACKDCNTDTQVRMANNAGEQTLHPYFDSVDDEIWLIAEVVAGTPPALRFVAAPPDDWSRNKKEMVRSHFAAFNLATLFTTHAAAELVNVYFDVVASGMANKQEELKAHFRERAENRRHVTRNSWQAAMYSALSESDWFCSGGYRFVADSTLIMQNQVVP